VDRLIVAAVIAAILTAYMAGPYLVYRALDAVALAAGRLLRAVLTRRRQSAT
jgi:general stress protein CsbA